MCWWWQRRCEAREGGKAVFGVVEFLSKAHVGIETPDIRENEKTKVVKGFNLFGVLLVEGAVVRVESFLLNRADAGHLCGAQGDECSSGGSGKLENSTEFGSVQDGIRM